VLHISTGINAQRIKAILDGMNAIAVKNIDLDKGR
jgi:hypothetical protein